MLEKHSWKSTRELFKKTKVALIPVGSTEQHGPHLPLGTDFFIAQALAEDAAKETGAICTPVIPIGVSEHHRQFWGTLWVTADAFRNYMKGIGESLAYHGIRRIIFVNGHGGNTAALQLVCRELRNEKIYALVWQWWTANTDLINKMFVGKGTHAGSSETSMIYAINESWVDKSSLEEAKRGASDMFGVSKYGATVSFDTLDFSESGATRDPTEASVEAGKKIYSAAKEQLIALVKWLEEVNESELSERPHKP